MIRFAAIGLVWIGCLVAWMILGSSLVVRSKESSGELRKEVSLLWGPELAQKPPVAVWRDTRTVSPATRTAPAQIVEDLVPLPLERSEIAVALDLEQRRKGLLWFPTYTVDFESAYSFRNATAVAHPVELASRSKRETACSMISASSTPRAPRSPWSSKRARRCGRTILPRGKRDNTACTTAREAPRPGTTT